LHLGKIPLSSNFSGTVHCTSENAPYPTHFLMLPTKTACFLKKWPPPLIAKALQPAGMLILKTISENFKELAI